MQSILTRSPMPVPTSAPSQRGVPRKTSSFLSLRRERDKSPLLDVYKTTDSPATFPSLSKQTYFDAYPRAASNPPSRRSKSKGNDSDTQQLASPTRTEPCNHEEPSMSGKRPRKPKEIAEKLPDETTFAFPTFEESRHVPSSYRGEVTPSLYTRTRSRTGPSGRSNWADIPSVPHLRFSGSSTQTGEAPRTPIDNTSSNSSLDFYPVVVAAPISGVETMDALVDGMNGSMAGGISMSSRARFGIPGHHPLYQPPLPTPPPGVVLGGGKSRRPPRPRDSDDDDNHHVPPVRHRRRRTRRPSRTTSNTNIIPSPSAIERPQSSPAFTKSVVPKPPTPPLRERPKSVVPSISEIIRTHAPPESQTRSRPIMSRNSSIYAHSQGHATLHEEPESEPEPLTLDEAAELMSRSSIDSIADEVQRTLRNQNMASAVASPTQHFHTPSNRHSLLSDNTSLYSPRSDVGPEPSIYASSLASSYPPCTPFDSPIHLGVKPFTPSQAVAQYLRSARLTTLLKLTRSPHASQDKPLTVSLSDLGSPTGAPLVMFLGLGCVRHVMGLYDEMAECLGLRLITVDRWGLGRTESRPKSAKGIMEWASVVEEVLDMLHIGQVSVMAHSAGAPYALSFANKLPGRIRGDICLLAPWVGGGEGGGYRWLKYVPNGILKTAQAAEWKVQAWMIGKPPTMAYEGIGYNASPTTKLTPDRKPSPSRAQGNLNVVYPSTGSRPRPSLGSSSFSEYDDLGDFDGRFESRSTLGAGMRSQYNRAASEANVTFGKRKTSRGFLERLKVGSSNSQPQSPLDERPSSGRGLKALRSMGSLKGKSSRIALSKKSEPISPQLPPARTMQFEVGLGLDDLSWETSSHKVENISPRSDILSLDGHGTYTRSSGRRSISFSLPRSSPPSHGGSPVTSTFSSPYMNTDPGSAYQAALGNALIAASHAESAKGTHNDLLQILNHENHPWGFSYTSYPHKVCVWYGDKDEKIAENAVRWMEHNMGPDRCSVKVVKGADHGLVYKSAVVVEVLERARGFW